MTASFSVELVEVAKTLILNISQYFPNFSENCNKLAYNLVENSEKHSSQEQLRDKALN